MLQAQQPSAEGPVRIVPPDPQPYFSPDAAGNLVPLERRAPAEMAPEDAQVLAARQAEMQRAAALYDFDLSAKGWSYEQAVCPALQGHLILNYRQVLPDVGTSRVVLVVPRAGARVRAIPVAHRGGSLWTPAPSNGLSLDVFQEVYAREQTAHGSPWRPGWLELALCYAEMTGDHPVPASESLPQEELTRRGATLPTLIRDKDERVQVLFSDVANPKLSYRWTLSFSAAGRLVKAERIEERGSLIRSVPVSDSAN